MSLFVDTGGFYAHQHRSAKRHEIATDSMARVLTGEFGKLWTSTYVFDEAITLTRVRTNSYEENQVLGNRILGRGDYPETIELLDVSMAAFDAALEVLGRYRDHSLNFTDATSIVLANQNDIDRILSFDDDFDGIVGRLDPGELSE